MNIRTYSKYKWLELFLFIPPILFLATINVIGDPSHYFQPSISETIAENIIKGNKVRSLSNEFNFRLIRKKEIEKMNKNIDCIAIGPSLIYKVGKENVNASSFYNLGVNSSTHYDLFTTFALLKLNQINYKKVIICIDFYSIFNVELAQNSKLSEPYINYYKSMIAFLEGHQNLTNPRIDYYSIIRNAPLLSISYFKSSFKNIIKSLKNNLYLIEIIDKNSNTTELHFSSDGSLVDAEHQENREEQLYLNAINKDFIITPLRPQGELAYRYKSVTNNDFKKHFLLLIDYLKKQNKEIVFWYHPFPPIVWDKINHKEYPGIYGLDTWSRNIAKEKDIKTIGSYNPYECGVTDECFADAHHLKRSAIDKHFKFFYD